MLRRLLLLGVLAITVLGCVASPATTASPTASPPSSPAPSVAGGPPAIVGTVTAGPVCPVEKSPPDPKCAPRPVPGAVIVATDKGGAEVGRTTSGADGAYRLTVTETGAILITAQPVAGLMGRPAPVTVTLCCPSVVEHLDLSYDTGIR